MRKTTTARAKRARSQPSNHAEWSSGDFVGTEEFEKSLEDFPTPDLSDYADIGWDTPAERIAWEEHVQLLRECREHFEETAHRHPRLFPREPAGHRKSVFSTNGYVGSPGESLTWNIAREESCFKKHDGVRIASPLCYKLCYVDRLERGRPGLAPKSRRNAKIRALPNFPRIFVGAWEYESLHRWREPSLIRLHSAGDFDSVPYLADFVEIAQMLPDVRFLAFTRCWRWKHLHAAVRQLAAQPNVFLHLSYDSTSGSPPAIPGAWTTPLLEKNDVPPPLRPTDCRAFRTRLVYEPPLKSVRDGRLRTIVCPQKSGAGDGDLSCLACGACLKRPPEGPAV